MILARIRFGAAGHEATLDDRHIWTSKTAPAFDKVARVFVDLDDYSPADGDFAAWWAQRLATVLGGSVVFVADLPEPDDGRLYSPPGV